MVKTCDNEGRKTVLEQTGLCWELPTGLHLQTQAEWGSSAVEPAFYRRVFRQFSWGDLVPFQDTG